MLPNSVTLEVRRKIDIAPGRFMGLAEMTVNRPEFPGDCFV
jgi:hypothetical protein